eukprot:SAG22_NODE_18107_length_293_cov_0.798969_1_plen_50_part_01
MKMVQDEPARGAAATAGVARFQLYTSQHAQEAAVAWVWNMRRLRERAPVF